LDGSDGLENAAFVALVHHFLGEDVCVGLNT
jgi:hypothetical protein